jgi:hypothetical protein
MLRMLVQVFGSNPITISRRLSGKRDISFEDLVRVASDLYIGTVAIKSLYPVRHSRAVVVRIVTIIATA